MQKILLTGAPRVGKTTLFQKLIAAAPRKQGFFTEEVRREGERCGFKIVTASGAEGSLASIDHPTPHAVQGRAATYYVDVAAFEAMLEPLFTFGSNDLLYLDEIGRMELFSETFKRLVETYLDSGRPFLGTVSQIYRDEFVERVLARSDVTLVEVTMENRDRLAEDLPRLFSEGYAG